MSRSARAACRRACCVVGCRYTRAAVWSLGSLQATRGQKNATNPHHITLGPPQGTAKAPWGRVSAGFQKTALESRHANRRFYPCPHPSYPTLLGSQGRQWLRVPLKTDGDSHGRTTWFDVDGAIETTGRHDILGSFGGRPALGLRTQEAGRSRARHWNDRSSSSGRSWSLAWSAPAPRENQAHCELRRTNRGAHTEHGQPQIG